MSKRPTLWMNLSVRAPSLQLYTTLPAAISTFTLPFKTHMTLWSWLPPSVWTHVLIVPPPPPLPPELLSGVLLAAPPPPPLAAGD